MNNLENDIPKHKKKKESSISKSNSKSKHKHEYAECLLVEDKSKTPYKATYCKICGKIGDLMLFDTVPYGNYEYRMLNANEMIEKYKDLKCFYVDNIWQKYVCVDKGGE